MAGQGPPDPAQPDERSTETFSEGTKPGAERRLGPYRLLKEIGHGGMGTVYQGVRTDETYHKRVAIKIIRGLDSEEVVRHFRRERRILASLDHPNIAKLLDGGTTEEGLPYFVMEFVEGEPIDVYCDHQGLSTAERLRLFRTVCHAVQHAHRNLVVHRDLKPANILVTTDGIVKLLDFGIAKILNPELLGEGGTATQMAFTPEYASPEQARGDPVTTATDVYSLGIVLYELLTGHRPYRLKSRQALDVLRAVVDEEPERPSTAVRRTEEVPAGPGTAPRTITPETVSRRRDATPDRLIRRLRGDLDNIVLTALRKEMPKRYGSVEALSEDLGRHLDGRPVLARKSTVGYRTAKFVRRNLVGVLSTTIVLLLILGFAVTTALQSAQVRGALAAAERERTKAERTAAFLTDLFRISDPSEGRGNTVTAREVLDKGAERISGELRDQPEVRASLMNTMGTVYRTLGLYDKARPLIEDALAARRQLLGNDHVEVAESLTSLGDLLFAKGDFAAAATAHAEALAVRRKRLGNGSLDVAASLSNQAWALLNAKSDFDEVERLFREALEIRRRAVSTDDPVIGDSLSDLGTVFWRKGDTAHAEALYREALALRRRAYGGDNYRVAASLNNLALISHDRGDLAGAESQLREALAMKRRLLGDTHPDVGRTLHNLASILNEHGDAVAAEGFYREAIAIQRKAMGEDNPRVASAMSGLAETLAAQDRLAEAESLYREALGVFRRAYPAGHPLVTPTLIGLGEVLIRKNDPWAAEPFLREALDGSRKAFAAGHTDIAEAASSLGACLTALRRYKEAEALLLESYPVLKKNRGEDNPLTKKAVQRLVALYEAWPRPDKIALYKTLLKDVR